LQLSELENKRVAIWGYGREGRAALAALRWRLPRAPLALLCSESEAAEAMQLGDPALYVFTEEVTPDLLARFDVVIKSPGISPYLGPAPAAAQRGVRFTSGTALWFGENADASTICVTGTKGKSTTSALIAHLLRSSGARIALAGNIGLPLLELLDVDPAPDCWVVELSSFQAGDAIAPEVAVVLNLFPEHLDWHGGEDRYYADKLALVTRGRPRNIVLNAADTRLAAFGRSPALAGVGSERSSQFGDLAPGARVHWFNSRAGWHVLGSTLRRGELDVMDCAGLPLVGTHNRGNLCAALTAIEALGLDALPLARQAFSFVPLPHRLQRLGIRDGREYVNDSISTTPHASLAALEVYANRRVAILVGGYDRGLDWSPFLARMNKEPPIAVIAMGQNGARIAQELAGAARGGRFILQQALEMPEAVRMADQALGAEGVVLLSPGAPSFPRYRSYVERGRHFAESSGFDPNKISAIAGLGVA
jgi:UDP-N-acetylmuramoyl-L-alanine---L-glutamate ligase